MPNLIGVQRGVGTQKVPPPPPLAGTGQVGDAGIPEDADKRVRRAMLTGQEGERVYLGLGLMVALKYLEKEKIQPVTLTSSPNTYQLGRAQFHPLQRDAGGYVGVDDRGYQTLLNFRGPASSFPTISFSDVLQNRLPETWLRDRIVLVGTTAESVKDIFLTPYSDAEGQSDWMAGVMIHANIISQIVSAALDGRPLLQGVPGSWRWVWILVGASAGVLVSWNVLQANWVNKHLSYGAAILATLLSSGGLVAIGYWIFLQGWWLPVATTVLALNGAAIGCFAYYSYKLQRLAYVDELTGVANRRYFDLYLARQIYRKGNLSLLLCDVDCFKLYNDTYGHQAGDRCLRSVAQTIRRATRNTDFTARYGGEEFAVVLPGTSVGEATLVAERILDQIRALQLPHQNSKAAPYVTLSCGVASVIIDDHRLRSSDWSGTHLLAQADKVLYTSKDSGRDRFTVITLDSVTD
jgi:diguanylate cyclase (GGDEF)-like protein